MNNTLVTNEPRTESLIGERIRRLVKINGAIGNLLDGLKETADRFYGAQPEAVANNTAGEARIGFIGELDRHLLETEALLEGLRHQAKLLESL